MIKTGIIYDYLKSNPICHLKTWAKILLLLIIFNSCSLGEHINPNNNAKSTLEYGSDFSIMKKMEDYGGTYKLNGIEKEGLQIFKENGFTWARLRIFHTPKNKGAVCNDLEYTIELANRAKLFGFKILLNFHYSDDWADPGHQLAPEVWKNLRHDILLDSVYNYTIHVMRAMINANVQPDMVQIGNEINNGMIWPQGKLWVEGGNANWDNLADLLKAGINGVKDSQDGEQVKIMIHAATGGNMVASNKFYNNIIQRDVNFDVIGLSYYPWWHGNFQKLEDNIHSLSKNFGQELSIVETAYYSNGWYPEASDWVLSEKPFPPTEQGQYDYLIELAERLKDHPRVKSVFYWNPDELNIPETKVYYLGRSLFDSKGNAFKGIAAWKTK